MNALLTELARLSSAEEFLVFLEVRYDEHVVQVNRLHILKRFYQYLQREPGLAQLDEAGLRERYRALLQRAHDDFVGSSAAQEKVFKVFQDAPTFPLQGLRDSLPSRSRAGDGGRG
jgi:nitrogenase-stabilizing/protective protein